MQKTDIFLAPSLSESYCWTVFEALQMGCKVFVTSSSPWAFVSKSDFIKTISPLLKDVKSNELFKSFKKMKKLPRYQFSYKKLSKLIEVSDINWRYMIKKDLHINNQDI